MDGFSKNDYTQRRLRFDLLPLTHPMSVKSLRYLLAASLLFSPLAQRPAQAEPLGDKVAAIHADWIIGSWVDAPTAGLGLKISYEWRLDKHAIALKATMADRQSEGLIAVNPRNGDVGIMVVDNRGGGAMGKVTAEDGKIVLTVKYTDGDGNDGKVALVHEKKDDSKVLVTVYAVNDSGGLGEKKESLELVKQPATK